MFDGIDGLPVHPLVVHGVVVLLPLAVLGTIAIAVRPAWRLTYGYLVVGVTAVATVLVPIAVESGEKLKTHRGDPGKHEELGQMMIWFALPLLALVIALVVMERRRSGEPAASDGRGALNAINVVAALSVVAALAAGVHVVRVGDSGSRAHWEGTLDQRAVQ